MAMGKADHTEAVRILTYFRLRGCAKFEVIHDMETMRDYVYGQTPEGKYFRVEFDRDIMDSHIIKSLLDTHVK